MTRQLQSILQVSTTDLGGGAEKIGWELFQTYRARGLESWLAVGRKFSPNPNVLVIPNHKEASAWERALKTLQNRVQPWEGKVRGATRLRLTLQAWSNPLRWWDKQQGLEDFRFPGTSHLLDLVPHQPDIIHCHNLHGSYFDLQILPELSKRTSVVLTLHDAWLLSGHCAHSFACERWKIGCGHCPDLTIYPAVKRDATAYNWRRKRDIYAKSRLFIATPCHWLMDKVYASMLHEGIQDSRVIPYGINLSIFRPSAKNAARETLGLPQDVRIVLFVANSIRKNIWKDYQIMREAMSLVAERLQGQQLLFLALGDTAPPEQISATTHIQFVPFQRDPQMVARYYQAADVYLHAARADTFPNTVLEALACGTPVIASAVGGIVEQVKGLPLEIPYQSSELNFYNRDQATGVLVSPGDPDAMADTILQLMADDALLSQLGHNAAKDAQQRFNLERQVDDYLSWYQTILDESYKPKVG